MKSSLTTFVLLLLNILSGCAPGTNQFKGTVSERDKVAGFWLGFWQGFIAPFVFVASLFKNNLGIYEVHNNGAWYNFGYLFGLACILAVAATGRHGGPNKSDKFVEYKRLWAYRQAHFFSLAGQFTIRAKLCAFVMSGDGFTRNRPSGATS